MCFYTALTIQQQLIRHTVLVVDMSVLVKFMIYGKPRLLSADHQHPYCHIEMF